MNKTDILNGLKIRYPDEIFVTQSDKTISDPSDFVESFKLEIEG